MSGAPLEIERVWVLRGEPCIPAGAEVWGIEQGYLPERSLQAADFAEGRLRRITRPDGAVRHLHTVKRGSGLVREEVESEIDAAAFERAWPATLGRRLRKQRHRVRDGDLTWEVDRFLDWPLWMAEVELPSAQAPAPIPEWLAPVLGTEVTTDPRWRNHALALQGPPKAPEA